MECENQRCYITGAGRAEGGDDGHAVPAGPVGEPGCDDCQVTCLVGHINIRENMQCAVWQTPLLVLLCLWLLLLFQVDADLEGSGWKTSPTGWFLFSDRPYSSWWSHC